MASISGIVMFKGRDDFELVLDQAGFDWVVRSRAARFRWILLSVVLVLSLAGIVWGLINLWWAPFYWIAFGLVGTAIAVAVRPRPSDGWALALSGSELTLLTWLAAPKCWSIAEIDRIFFHEWFRHVEEVSQQVAELSVVFADGTSLNVTSISAAYELRERLVELKPRLVVEDVRLRDTGLRSTHVLGSMAFGHTVPGARWLVWMLVIPAVMFAGFAGLVSAKPNVAPVSPSVVSANLASLSDVIPNDQLGDDTKIRLPAGEVTACGPVWSSGYWGPWDGDYHAGSVSWRGGTDTWGGNELSEPDQQAIVDRAAEVGLRPAEMPPELAERTEPDSPDPVAMAAASDGVEILLVVGANRQRHAQVKVTTPCQRGSRPAQEQNGKAERIIRYILTGRS